MSRPWHFEAAQVFRRMSSTQIFRAELMDFGKTVTERKSPFHWGYAVMVLLLVMSDLITRFGWGLLGYPTIVLLGIFFLLHTRLRGEDDRTQPALHTKFKGPRPGPGRPGGIPKRLWRCVKSKSFGGRSFEAYTSIFFFPTVLLAHFTSQWVWDYYCGVLMVISISLIPSMFIIWNSSVTKIWLFFLNYLFNYLLIY